MKTRILNPLGLLSLLALIALLAPVTGNMGLFGFFGFVYYIRYFFVIPDELFRFNMQRAATAAFLSEMVSLVPFMFICTHLYGGMGGVPTAFGLSFAVCIFAFTAALTVLEWREKRGAA